MKKLLLSLLAIIPLSAVAQDLYITGGYTTDRPAIKDGVSSGYNGTMNGETHIDKIRQSGFFAGLGINIKAKKTSNLGLRIEAAYEQNAFDMQTTVSAQQEMFGPRQQFAFNVSEPNSYIRFAPTLSYYKLRRSAINYQVDLGLSQFIHVSGWRDNSSYTAMHISAGIGYNGVILKAGTDLGLSDMFDGDGKSYNITSRRFFVGVHAYPFIFIRKKAKIVEVKD